ncbi:MAG: pentapeptide repeat-containing protein [Planctomycetes bacterium]|nr:pentapeptide repeat-containing protein [Planctomycetota bacterium]
MDAPILPLRAAVKPRIWDEELGGTVPLEDEIVRIFKSQSARNVVLVGPPGSGKSTALAHLKAVLPEHFPIEMYDANVSQRAEVTPGRLRISSRRTEGWNHAFGTEQLTIAPWGYDEWIEYLLARHPSVCASVMKRLHEHPEIKALNGLPALWSVVLDAMAEDETLDGPLQALQNYLAKRMTRPQHRRAGTRSLLAYLENGWVLTRSRTCLPGAGNAARETALNRLCSLPCTEIAPEWAQLENLSASRLVLAADFIAHDLERFEACDYFLWRFPSDLIQQVGILLRRRPALCAHAVTLATGADPNLHATAASFLVAADPTWRPPQGKPLNLAGALLAGAQWTGIRLPDGNFLHADLRGARLDGANLESANLKAADASGADLSEACLQNADLTQSIWARSNLEGCDLKYATAGFAHFRRAILRNAELSQADLMFADLRDADFRAAKLQGAVLQGAKIAGADFRAANLKQANLAKLVLREANFLGADFPAANLRGADLQGMELPNADFCAADLLGADLTGSRMPGANFRGAMLGNTGLAGVDWERADLRGACFANASFHMGSSRSGLVHSPLACEGSRTGFYTDEFYEQSFKAPEAIRKANLRGCDLRGAKIEDIDFYLVDLRDAKLDPEQRDHLRRCGAILEHKAAPA